MKHLQTRKCECGHEFTAKDIKPPLNRVGRGFYGGNVDRTCEAACPKCREKYVLFIQQTGQTWRVVTIAAMKTAPNAKAEELRTAAPAGPVNPDDAFDDMDQEQLRAWLDARDIKYHSQLGEKKLRVQCREVLAAELQVPEGGDGQ